MLQVSRRFLSPRVEKRIRDLLYSSFGKLKKSNEVRLFLDDLLTPTEKIMLAKRISIAYLLLRGDLDYRLIANTLKVSTNTVNKVKNVLKMRGKGYEIVVRKLLRDQKVKDVLLGLFEYSPPKPARGARVGEWIRPDKLSESKDAI